MSQLPIPVCVGSESPEFWNDTEEQQQTHGAEASRWLRQQRRPAVAAVALEWNKVGFDPRWVGQDSTDCAAALDPGIFTRKGADEFDRFRRGAASRGETALVISPIGRHDGDGSWNAFGPSDSIQLGQFRSQIDARPLGEGARVHVAPDLSAADKALAQRLLNCNPPPSWWVLTLDGQTTHGPDGMREHPAAGTLQPIIATELSEPVVAIWLSPDGIERRYIVPDSAPWSVLLEWLLLHGLPDIVPGSMRRARRHLRSDPAMLTVRERATLAELASLKSDYEARRAALQHTLNDLQTEAQVVREGLLYGTSGTLVRAVRLALEAAGIQVVDLDNALGGTRNADLLCTYGGRSRLIEVKSASGPASEAIYNDLIRHLREWDYLPSNSPVEGGALVLNHEYRLPPDQRRKRPFERPEFLAAQNELVVPTIDLFAAWRDGDMGGVRNLVFPSPPPPSTVERPAGPAPRTTAQAPAVEPAETPPTRSWWRHRWLRR